MPSKRTGIWKAIGVWAPTVILGLFFVMQGLMKFDARAGRGARFADWGYPGRRFAAHASPAGEAGPAGI